MKSTPKLNNFKVRSQALLRKKKGLTREMEVLWSRETPKKTRQHTAWCVLSSLVSDLSPDLPPSLIEKLTSCIETRDVTGYLNLGSELGDVQLYSSPRSYFAATSVLNLLKKFSWVDGKVNPLLKAVERFHEAEKLCKRTNKRFSHYRQFDFANRPLVKGLDVHQVFHLARRKIQNWIGVLEFSDLLNHVKHGPGGTVGLRRPFTTPYYKFSATSYTVSTGSYFHAYRAVASSDTWVRALAQSEGLIDWDHSVSCIPRETKLRLFDQRVEITNYNNVTFVPKNAKTHRAIAIEPSLNVMIQLAAGSHIRDCLRRAGCDLRDQTRNQELARVGSLQRDPHDPVTLDLSMASDTLSIELVRELLPCEWFEYLDQLRSREGRFNGETFKWEKFSSMGNGFTFELESMIFYALSQSVSDLSGETEWFSSTFGPEFKYSYVSVYGDDIIVPKRMSEHLVKILGFCGFKLNHEKSFTDGPFRESCGKDYYDGILVRPYLLERGLSHVKDYIHLLNNLKDLGTEFGFVTASTQAYVSSLIPTILMKHLRGPRKTTGDGYIWFDPDDCHTSSFVVWDTDMQTWLYPSVKTTLTLHRGNVFWRYCQFLYGNTGTRPALASSEWSNDQFSLHVSGGGSSGDVVLSGTNGDGQLTIST